MSLLAYCLLLIAYCLLLIAYCLQMGEAERFGADRSHKHQVLALPSVRPFLKFS